MAEPVQCPRCGNVTMPDTECSTCETFLRLGILPEDARMHRMELYDVETMLQEASQQLMQVAQSAAELEQVTDDPLERTKLLALLMENLSAVTGENARLLARQYYFIRSQRARLN